MSHQHLKRSTPILILLLLAGVLLFPTAKKWQQDPSLRAHYNGFIAYATESFMTSAPVVKARRFFGQTDHAFVSDVRAGDAAAKADAAGY